MVMAATHTSTMTMASTAAALSVSASYLLPVWWDHCWLISTHLVVTHRSIVTMEATTTSSWWEGRPTTTSSSSAAATTTTLVVALVLGFSLLDIDSSPINLSNWVVLNQILSNRLVGECNEAEAT